MNELWDTTVIPNKKDIVENFDTNIYSQDDIKFIPVNDGKNDHVVDYIDVINTFI